MFPNLDRVDLNQPSSGKAFDVLVESHGLGVSCRQVTVRPEGWDECTACEVYRDGYDLSMASLALATVLDARM